MQYNIIYIKFIYLINTGHLKKVKVLHIQSLFQLWLLNFRINGVFVCIPSSQVALLPSGTIKSDKIDIADHSCFG